MSYNIKLNHHVFYLNIDLRDYFPDSYDEEELYVMPLEFTGRLYFFKSRESIFSGIRGSYYLQVSKSHKHAKEVADNIGFITIDSEFKNRLWNDPFMMDQTYYLYRSMVTKKSEEYQLIEEF